jgi:hypothetical protein
MRTLRSMIPEQNIVIPNNDMDHPLGCMCPIREAVPEPFPQHVPRVAVQLVAVGRADCSIHQTHVLPCEGKEGNIRSSVGTTSSYTRACSGTRTGNRRVDHTSKKSSSLAQR